MGMCCPSEQAGAGNGAPCLSERAATVKCILFRVEKAIGEIGAVIRHFAEESKLCSVHFRDISGVHDHFM